MIASLYSSAAGMMGQITQQDVISNNLANCNSSGYKRQRVGFSAFSVELANAQNGKPTPGTGNVKTVLPQPYEREDSVQGEMRDTGNSTNLAIDGPGYFVVKTSTGQQRLTRDGNFRLDSANHLVTQEGDIALGNKGPITLNSSKWEVAPDGTITADGAVIDKMRIESSPGDPGSKPGRVVQGEIESSNVNAIEESTGMITTLRAYEASQKVIQSIDQTLDKVINMAGK